MVDDSPMTLRPESNGFARKLTRFGESGFSLSSEKNVGTCPIAKAAEAKRTARLTKHRFLISLAFPSKYIPNPS
jgi:hypothetical protein